MLQEKEKSSAIDSKKRKVGLFMVHLFFGKSRVLIYNVLRIKENLRLLVKKKLLLFSVK